MPGPRWKLALLLCCLGYFYILGAVIFARGFLLTRTETGEKAARPWVSGARPKFKRAVILIVDALKYDFALWDDTTTDAAPYRNKLTSIHNALEDHPNNSRLYRFVADPPTTTMQRLKALTTGSLPTFVDAGDNFAGYEIKEDNIIDQMRDNGKRIVFLGDDTWTGLFPRKFVRSFPFPSFDVWDLDTVDDGVKRQLRREMESSEWDVIVAHFLGVDHCGHRYGPNHPEMARKLTEMNEVIRYIMQKIEKDTVLLVLGDHGMTRTGDHGGDSDDEVSAALFVYSPVVPLIEQPPFDPNVIPQVDFVPTLCILLGIPVPIPSLGVVLLDLVLPVNGDPVQYGTNLLMQNVKHVEHYISSYFEAYGQFSVSDMRHMDRMTAVIRVMADDVTDLKQFVSFVPYVRRYFQAVRDMCASVWVRFDMPKMEVGLMLVVTTTLLSAGFGAVTRIWTGSLFAATMLTVVGSAAAMLYSQEFELYVGIAGVKMVTVLVVAAVLKARPSIALPNWTTVAVSSVTCVSLFGLFSNSYVVEEASVLSYTALTCIWIQCWSLRTTVDFAKGRSRFSRHKTYALVTLLILTALVRASHLFWRCREEQPWCEPSDFHRPLSAIPQVRHTYKSWRYFFTLTTLAACVTLHRMWWRGSGNLNGYSAVVIVARYSCGTAVVLMSAYWAMTGFHERAWHARAFAQAAAAILALSGFIAVVQPLCVYVLRESAVDASVPSVYSYLKANWGQQRNKTPIVYGLSSVCSTVLSLAAVLTTLALCMVLGDGMAMAGVAMLATLMTYVMLSAVIRMEKSVALPDVFNVPWSVVISYSLLSWYFFYGTGHQPTFPTIPWEAAVVAPTSALTRALAAMCVSVHLHAAQVLFGFCLPLLLVAPSAIHVMCPHLGYSESLLSQVGAAHVRKGEVFLLWEREGCLGGWGSAAGKYLACHGIKLLCSMAAATLHRRHLMVWKIFAPRFVFEAVSMMVAVPAVLLGILLAFRVSSALEKFMLSLQVSSGSRNSQAEDIED